MSKKEIPNAFNACIQLQALNLHANAIIGIISTLILNNANVKNRVFVIKSNLECAKGCLSCTGSH